MIGFKKFVSLMCLFLVLAHIPQTAAAERPIRILSLDGGGVRGLIPATILASIEEQTGKKITDLFDVMVGTSTGGLITLFLNVPNASRTGPKYSAKEVVQLYKDLSAKIFPKSLWRSVRTLGGLIGSKWSAKPAEEFLQKYFGELKMRDTVRDVVITSMDTKSKTLFPFSTYVAKSNLYNFYLWQAGRATSAAPTFFKPFELDLQGWAKLTLVDGGIGANNPGILGVMEAKKIYPNRDYILVSLGTGKTSELGKVVSKGNLAGGILQMLKPTIAGMFTGQDQLSDKAAEALVTSPNFYRINPEIDPDLENMDNTDPKNLAALEAVGANIVKSDPTLKRLISTLNAAQ